MSILSWGRLVSMSVVLPCLLIADQVTLKNGDRVTGQIVKKDGDKLTMKSEFLGEVTIPWGAITAISSTEPLVVVLPGGKSLTGNLSTSGENLEVVTATGRETAALSEVSVLRNAEEEKKYERLQNPGLLELWTGYADLGLALARGNAHTSTFTTGFNASRATRNDKITANFTQIYSTATVEGQTAATAEAVRGGWAYDRNVNSRLFVNTFNDYEYDKFQDLDLRFVIGGGFGFSAVKSDRSRLDVSGGGDYNRSHFTTLTRNSAEAFFGDNWSYKLSGITSLTQSFRIFPNLTNTGEYRINFDLSAVTNLNNWLSWQVTASDRFLSDPVFGRKRNDVLLTTGFRVSFAR